MLSEIEQKAPIPGDQLDEARQHEEMDLHVSFIEMSERRLAAICSAFERLEHGRYGICEACGDRISFERLRAMPTALHCVDCQAELETATAHKRDAISASIEADRVSSDTMVPDSHKDEYRDSGADGRVHRWFHRGVKRGTR